MSQARQRPAARPSFKDQEDSEESVTSEKGSFGLWDYFLAAVLIAIAVALVVAFGPFLLGALGTLLFWLLSPLGLLVVFAVIILTIFFR